MDTSSPPAIKLLINFGLGARLTFDVVSEIQEPIVGDDVLRLLSLFFISLNRTLKNSRAMVVFSSGLGGKFSVAPRTSRHLTRVYRGDRWMRGVFNVAAIKS